jgi:hypothetical protein
MAFNGLLGVVSQKAELFIKTAVITSNPTQSAASADNRRNVFFYFINCTGVISLNTVSKYVP